MKTALTLALTLAVIATSAQAMCRKRCTTNERGENVCITVCN